MMKCAQLKKANRRWITNDPDVDDIVRGDLGPEWRGASLYRVVGPDGACWCETSYQREALERMRPGDTLYARFTKTTEKFIEQPVEFQDVTEFMV